MYSFLFSAITTSRNKKQSNVVNNELVKIPNSLFTPFQLQKQSDNN